MSINATSRPNVEGAESLRCLVCVSDRTGVEEFAGCLDDLGWRIFSTPGTARALAENGLQVTPIEELTGNGSCLGGRVKTFSHELFMGILYRRDHLDDVAEVAESNAVPIHMVVQNCYELRSGGLNPTSAAKPELFDVESIDVGGPSLIRAAAKNFRHVLPVSSPADYAEVTAALTAAGSWPEAIPEEFRRTLARRTFARLAAYDSAIAQLV